MLFRHCSRRIPDSKRVEKVLNEILVSRYRSIDVQESDGGVRCSITVCATFYISASSGASKHHEGQQSREHFYKTLDEHSRFRR